MHGKAFGSGLCLCTMVGFGLPSCAGKAQMGNVGVNDLSLKVVSPSGTTYWGNFGVVNCQ